MFFTSVNWIFTAYSFSHLLFNLVDKTRRHNLGRFFSPRGSNRKPGVLASQNLKPGARTDQKRILWKSVVLSTSPSPCGNEVVCQLTTLHMGFSAFIWNVSSTICSSGFPNTKLCPQPQTLRFIRQY